MIHYFINRVSGNIRLFRPEVMVSVPAGVTSTEKRAVIDATKAAGAKDVYIIPEPVAAAIGADIPIDSAAGNLVVDIGGGTTEVAIISLAELLPQLRSGLEVIGSINPLLTTSDVNMVCNWRSNGRRNKD